MQMLSGDMATHDKPKPKYPDWMCVTNYLRSRSTARNNPLPRHLGANPPLECNHPAHLGEAYRPFTVSGPPSLPTFSAPSRGVSDAAERDRLDRCFGLRRRLDGLQRAVDGQSEMEALDRFGSRR